MDLWLLQADTHGVNCSCLLLADSSLMDAIEPHETALAKGIHQLVTKLFVRGLNFHKWSVHEATSSIQLRR
jgi:hypothetical protein